MRIYTATGQPVAPAVAGTAAADVTYDNTASGLAGSDVQAAIDELAAGAGDPVVLGSVLATSLATDWSDFTITGKIAARGLLTQTRKWKFSWEIDTGSCDIDHAVVRRTAIDDPTYIDSTPITWSANPAPTLNAGLTFSDEIDVAIDSAHDVYILIYLNTTTNNTAVAIKDGTGSSLGLTGTSTAGDQTAAASAPATTSALLGYALALRA